MTNKEYLYIFIIVIIVSGFIIYVNRIYIAALLVPTATVVSTTPSVVSTTPSVVSTTPSAVATTVPTATVVSTTPSVVSTTPSVVSTTPSAVATTVPTAIVVTNVPINCEGGDVNLDSSYSTWSDWTYDNSCPSVTNYIVPDSEFEKIRTKTRTYKKTINESQGGTCPQNATNYTKKTEKFTCPRNCFGTWSDWTKCDIECPGNSSSSNNFMSTQNLYRISAMQRRKFLINKSKLGSGAECLYENGIEQLQNCEGRDCKCTVERVYGPWRYNQPLCIGKPPQFTARGRYRYITITKKNGDDNCIIEKINNNEKAINKSDEVDGQLEFVSNNSTIKTREDEAVKKSPHFLITLQPTIYPILGACTEVMINKDNIANMKIEGGVKLKVTDSDTKIKIDTNFVFIQDIENIYWSKDAELIFGEDVEGRYQKIISLGTPDKDFKKIIKSIYTFPEINILNHNIKRFIVTQEYTLLGVNFRNPFEVKMEIRLISGIVFNYIEISMIYDPERLKLYNSNFWGVKIRSHTNKYIYTIDGKTNPSPDDIFLSLPIVNSNCSFVLRDIKSNFSWELFKNHKIIL